jgi:hypothetical protein
MRFSINKEVIQSYPMIVESIPYTWAAGQTQIVNLDFLSRAKQLKYGVIKSLKIRTLISNFSTGASGGPMRTLPLMYSNVRVRDLNGFRYNVRGSSLRNIMHIMDPTWGDTLYGANIAASQTNQVREFMLRMRFDWPFRARREKDFGLPIAMLLDGGEVSITAAPSATLITGFQTIVAATFTIVAEIVDYGVPEVGPVMQWQDWTIPSPEYYYPCNGYLYYAGAYVGEGNLGAQTAFASQQITSKTFDYSALQDTILRDAYRDSQCSVMKQNILPDATTTFAAGTIEDCHLTGEAVALYAPNFSQANIDAPYLENIHYKSSLGSISSTPIPTFLIGSIAPGREAVAVERAVQGMTRLPDSALTIVTNDGNNPRADQVSDKVRALSALRINQKA